jgi:putative two-component system response regulator
MYEKQVVLAVDDRAEVLTGISEMLDEDYDVRAVKSAAAAMSLLRAEKVDLIILDIDMPVLSGFDFFTFIKRNVQTECIPVVFITAVSDPAIIKKARESKAAGFILKPFTADILRNKVQSILVH